MNFFSSGSTINAFDVESITQNDIIERTIGIVLGPSTALYRSLLERCTMTNKALGTILQDFPNLLKGDKALILAPSDCQSELIALGPELACIQLVA